MTRKSKPDAKKDKLIVATLSESVKEFRKFVPVFIIGLGYTEDQAAKFVDGYLAFIKDKGTMAKMFALSHQYGPAMTAGFKAAGIDEDEAFKRFTSKKGKKLGAKVAKQVVEDT